MPEPIHRDRLDGAAVAVAVFCCALWGGNSVAVKYAIPDLPPIGCAAVRFLIGLPVNFLIWRSSGHSLRVDRSLWWLVLLHGLFTVVQIGTFNWGTSHSEAGRSSVFINIHPLVVAPLAWLVLGERMGPRGVAGLVSAAAGVLVLLSEPYRRGGTGGMLTGDLVVLGSGLVFGVQTIVQKLTFPRIPATTLLVLQTAVAAALAGSTSLAWEGPGAFHFTRGAVLGVLYQGLAVSGCAFGIWFILLRRYPAGRLATIAFLTPLIGVGLGHVTRGEPLTPPLLVGGAFVGFGIFLSASGRVPRTTPPPFEIDTDLGLPGEDAL